MRSSGQKAREEKDTALVEAFFKEFHSENDEKCDDNCRVL